MIDATESIMNTLQLNIKAGERYAELKQKILENMCARNRNNYSIFVLFHKESRSVITSISPGATSSSRS
jgi:hypothetical protein